MKKYSMPKQDTLTSERVMQLSESKHKLTSFVIMTLFPFYSATRLTVATQQTLTFDNYV